jgi:pyrroline-5-carboxylate reductase
VTKSHELDICHTQSLAQRMARELVPDWILQQTLEVQKAANMAWVGGKKELDDGGLTLTALGCGTMGVAILGGIMDSLKELNKSSSSRPIGENTLDQSSPALPKRLPSKFNACVRRKESAKRVTDALDKYDARLETRVDDNIEAVKAADVVLLGCKPYMVAGILQAEGMREALAGKLLISILAGVPKSQIHDILYKDAPAGDKECTIVRAMPNTAAAVRESMTMIEVSSPALDPETDALVTWIFTRIGKVVHLPASNMDACTALCGSGPAFVALIIESMAAGAIAMGIPRDEAYAMAAQTARGTTGLLQAGEHPAILRDKVTTPGGCTIGGLLVLEEGGVRGTVAKAVREATVVASQLGQGKQGVNGTRH